MIKVIKYGLELGVRCIDMESFRSLTESKRLLSREETMKNKRGLRT